MNEFIDFLMGKIVIPGVILLFIIAVPVMLYDEWKQRNSPVIELRKSDWVCSAHENRSNTVYSSTGNGIMVPITTYYKHCTQWSESHD